MSLGNAPQGVVANRNRGSSDSDKKQLRLRSIIVRVSANTQRTGVLFCPTGWSVWLALGRWERPKSLAIQRTKRARRSFVLRKNSVDEAGWLNFHAFHDGFVDRKPRDDDGVHLRTKCLHSWSPVQWEL